MSNDDVHNTSNKAIKAMNKMVNSLHLQSDEDIETLVAKTETALKALMDELKRRQDDEQHRNIDYLDEHLENADTSFKSLRRFIAMAMNELKQ